MTAITEIKIHWAESFLIKEGATFASLAEANQVLEKLAKARKDTGGYTKVAYTATFEDGAQYDGRFDVQAIDAPQETSNGALCFLQAMRDFISFKAGMRKPEWMTAEQYSTSVDRSPEVLEWVARVGLAAA